MSEPRTSFLRYWREGTAHAWVNIFADWQREAGVKEKTLDKRKYLYAGLTIWNIGLLIALARFAVLKKVC